MQSIIQQLLCSKFQQAAPTQTPHPRTDICLCHVEKKVFPAWNCTLCTCLERDGCGYPIRSCLCQQEEQPNTESRPLTCIHLTSILLYSNLPTIPRKEDTPRGQITRPHARQGFLPFENEVYLSSGGGSHVIYSPLTLPVNNPCVRSPRHVWL